MQIEQDKLGDVTRTHSAPSVSTWLCVVRDGAPMPTPPSPSFYAIRSTPCPLCHLRLRQSRLMCQLLPRPRQSTWHPSAPVCPSAPAPIVTAPLLQSMPATIYSSITLPIPGTMCFTERSASIYCCTMCSHLHRRVLIFNSDSCGCACIYREAFELVNG